MSERPAPRAAAGEIPTLTDVVPDPQLGGDAATAAGIDREPEAAPRASGQVISRVQAQNLEHAVYQKLRKNLDAHIAQVIQNRFMPEIGSALNSALQHITQDLRT